MVDRSNIGQANRLNQQYLAYRDVLVLFERNPHIAAFTLEVPAPPPSEGEDADELPQQLTVLAEGIATPPQMLTAIKDQIEQRLKQINEQLTELGVAAASPAPAAAPQPRATPHKPEPPKHEPPKHEPHKPSPRNTRR